MEEQQGLPKSSARVFLPSLPTLTELSPGPQMSPVLEPLPEPSAPPPSAGGYNTSLLSSSSPHAFICCWTHQREGIILVLSCQTITDAVTLERKYEPSPLAFQATYNGHPAGFLSIAMLPSKGGPGISYGYWHLQFFKTLTHAGGGGVGSYLQVCGTFCSAALERAATLI